MRSPSSSCAASRVRSGQSRRETPRRRGFTYQKLFDHSAGEPSVTVDGDGVDLEQPRVGQHRLGQPPHLVLVVAAMAKQAAREGWRCAQLGGGAAPEAEVRRDSLFHLPSAVVGLDGILPGSDGHRALAHLGPALGQLGSLTLQEAPTFTGHSFSEGRKSSVRRIVAGTNLGTKERSEEQALL